MKRHSHLIAATAAVFALTGCLGGAFELGSAANPPTNVRLAPGDGSITVSWTAAPNVEYWIFTAPADNISTDNWARLVGARAVINATSPYVVSGLLNDVRYSFTVNARTDGGPGGPGSPSMSAMPRLAGSEWSLGKALSNDMRGVTFGTVFVAVGARGALYSSPDFNSWTPVTWTPLTNPRSDLPDLNAIGFGYVNYLAVGAGGTVLLSTDAITWTAQSGGTTSDLFAVATNGSNAFLAVAVGASGTIITSPDGKTWTAANSGTTQDLYGLTYANGLFVAVGANGTVVTSADGVKWNLAVSNVARKLSSVTFGLDSGGLGIFAAVGDAGTLITSLDGSTWTVQSPITGGNLTAIVYGRQYVAVGEKGMILTSANASTWTSQVSGTTNTLKAIARSTTNYSAVGSSGTNLSAI